MRKPVILLALAGVLLAVAVVAGLRFLPGQAAHRDVNHTTNDLCIVAPATPYDAATGLAMIDPKPIPATARCPVCGMYPARFPHWAAQTVFSDGASHYFDSPVDQFAYLHNIDRYGKRYSREDVVVSYVADHESGQWLVTQKAFYVQGSSAMGPMRTADLPAFSSRQLAVQFARSHGGKVLAYADVTADLIQSLNRNVHHRH
jgi:copper chaperone NosL